MKTLALASLLTLFGSAAFAADVTGYISDSQCATEFGKAAKATDWIKPKGFESCVKKCVQGGFAPVFLTEDNKIVKLDAASLEKAMQHLGKKVAVKAQIENGVIRIDSISDLDW